MKKLLLMVVILTTFVALNAQKPEYKLKYLKGYGPDSISAKGLGNCNWDKITDWTYITNPGFKLDGSLVAPEGNDFIAKFKLAYNEYAMFGIIDVVDDVIVPYMGGDNGEYYEVDGFTIKMGADQIYWPANTYVGYDVNPVLMDKWWLGEDQECVTHKISDTHYQIEFSFRWRIIWTKKPDQEITFPADTMNLEFVAMDCDEPLAGLQSQMQWGDATGVAQNAMDEGNYIATNWGLSILPEVETATAADTITYSANCNVGIKNINYSELSFYPNPVRGQIYFDNNIDACLYNALGTQVRKISNKNVMDVSDLQSGIYFIRTSKNEVGKVIVK